MAKKQKTVKQQKKAYKRLGHLCFVGEFGSVFAPFIAIGIVNYEKYFIQYNGTKISIGFALAMVIMGIATWLVAKKEFKQSFITLLVAWAMVTGILFLIKEILNDICYIMLFGWLGLVGAYGLDLGKKALYKKADRIDAQIKAAEDENTKEQYKEEFAKEQEAKKIKVKIKK